MHLTNALASVIRMIFHCNTYFGKKVILLKLLDINAMEQQHALSANFDKTSSIHSQSGRVSQIILPKNYRKENR